MLRADNVICGTSTTGTGPLTLAACPAPPGGLDFDKWLKATGYNFASGNAVIVSYTIIEYKTSAFATATQMEKGVGTLTLSSGISTATLARTTVQSTSTGLDTSTPSPTFASPTAITIGTAANTLVFVGNSALGEYEPFFNNTSTVGLPPLNAASLSATFLLTSGVHNYFPFKWVMPMLVKRCSLVNWSGYAGGTPVSNGYLAIYATGTDGKPGKLLIDFGVVGTAGSSFFPSFNILSTALASPGYFLTPGEYILDLAASWSGGTSSAPEPMFYSQSSPISGRMGTGTVTNSSMFSAMRSDASGTLSPAPDQAYVTGFTGQAGMGPIAFFLGNT